MHIKYIIRVTYHEFKMSVCVDQNMMKFTEHINGICVGGLAHIIYIYYYANAIVFNKIFLDKSPKIFGRLPTNKRTCCRFFFKVKVRTSAETPLKKISKNAIKLCARYKNLKYTNFALRFITIIIYGKECEKCFLVS